MGHDEAIIFENKYGVLTPDLRQMCNDIVERGVTEAAMESTAVYWVPVWNELCGSMELKLVNPYFIKQLPGRKSDVKDARRRPTGKSSAGGKSRCWRLSTTAKPAATSPGN